MANIRKILGILSLCCFFGCAKEEVSPIPYVMINVTIPIYGNTELLGGNPVKVTTGPMPPYGYNNHGIIISPYGSEFYAYDATCTKDISHAVNIDGGGVFTATCPKCKITYNILGSNNGFPKNNSAVARLKQYRALVDSDRLRLTVTNY